MSRTVCIVALLLLTWALLAGTSEGQLYVRVFNTGEIDISCSDQRHCPPGV